MDELIAELMKKSRSSYEAGKALLDKAKKENRQPSAEEMASVNKAFDESQASKDQADKMLDTKKRQEELHRFHTDPVNRLPGTGSGEPEVRTFFPEDPDAESKEEKEARKRLHRKLVLAQLRGRSSRMTDREQRALSSLNDPDGGYAVPEEMLNRFIVKLRDLAKIRGLATVFSTQAASISMMAEDYDPDAPTTKEGAAVTIEDIKNWLGRTRLTPHARKRIFKVPVELLEDASFDIEGYLVNRWAQRYKELEESDFINGDGVEKAIGIAKVTLNGEDGQTSGAVVHPLDVVNTVYGLKEQYRASGSCAFLMNRTSVKRVRSLRDESGGAGTGQLMWGPPIAAGSPQTLHGFPILESEFLAAPAATGDPHWIFGDWSYYWIVDRTQMQTQRLVELYAGNDLVGVLFRKRYDGAPVLKDAFYRLNRKA